MKRLPGGTCKPGRFKPPRWRISNPTSTAPPTNCSKPSPSAPLAASVSFDRAAPALGISLAYLLLNYFFEILGSLWDAAAWTQEYSLFHHFQPGEILTGSPETGDLLLLLAAILVPTAWALVVYPRRDLAAPA